MSLKPVASPTDWSTEAISNLGTIQASRPQKRQHQLGESATLVEVRVSGQDERINAEVAIGLDLVCHLSWRSDNGGTTTTASASDAGPEIRLRIAIFIAANAQRRLRFDSY
jgi:hypothetical protein